jgi:hypothetical protein
MSLAASCAILALCIAPAAVLSAWVSTREWSAETFLAAAIGGAVCLLAGCLALAATFLGNLWNAPVQGVLAGMLFRLGLPLIALVALPKIDQAWVPAGVTATILGVYLVALVVETGLALRMAPVQPQSAVPRPAKVS